MYFHIIMPISTDPDMQLKKQILTSLGRKYGIIAIIPQYNLDIPAFSISKFLESIIDSSFILVDLSFERPSCYFELGIAETTKTKIYIIAQADTPIHQTSHRDAVRYYKDLDDYTELVKDIISKHND